MERESGSDMSTSRTKREPKVIRAEYVDGQISEPGMVQLHSKVIYMTLMNVR